MVPVRHFSLSSRCLKLTRPTCRLVHSTSTRYATPLPFATALGPPPPAPIPLTPNPEERLARKRKQADLISQLQSSRPDRKKEGSVSKKRFWKDVHVKETEEGLQVHLDTRPVRTASKRILTLPHSKKHLATAIALEWDQLVGAQQATKTHHIPLTSLVSRAMDILAEDEAGSTEIRDGIMTMLLRYFDTDTLLCWAPEKNLHEPRADEGRESLRSIQTRVAKPIIAHITTKIWPGVEIAPVLDADSILPAPQPEMTVQVIRGWIAGLPAYELAGLERAVLATKSLLVSTRMLVDWSEQYAHLREGDRFGIEEAAEACTLEVRWQTGQWGEVEDTHDVEREDLRRQLGSVVLLVHGDKA